MVLLRRVIGDALRARRQGQHRTLREISSAANVSLGYLSEIERGQKEASSELLASICDALGARLSEVLREVSDHVARSEQVPDPLVSAGERAADQAALAGQAVGVRPRSATHVVRREAVEPAGPIRVRSQVSVRTVTDGNGRKAATDGNVSVSVRQDSPLKAVLRTPRRVRNAGDRDVVCAA